MASCRLPATPYNLFNNVDTIVGRLEAGSPGKEGSSITSRVLRSRLILAYLKATPYAICFFK